MLAGRSGGLQPKEKKQSARTSCLRVIAAGASRNQKMINFRTTRSKINFSFVGDAEATQVAIYKVEEHGGKNIFNIVRSPPAL